MNHTAPYKVLAELAATNSRLDKLAILKREAAAKNTELFDGLKLACDAQAVFHVKQVPERTGKDGPGQYFTNFQYLTDLLRNRTVTGFNAKDSIKCLMDSCTNDQWNGWYRRILMKDLRCGMTENTINKALETLNQDDYKVTTFKCMLAKDAGKDPAKYLRYIKILEPKFDGSRILALFVNEKVTLYSRNGKVFKNFPDIEKSLNEALRKNYGADVVIDGEVVSTSFNALMKNIHRKEGAQTKEAKYAIFDILPYKEFMEGQSNLTFTDRRKELERVFKSYFDKFSNLVLVPGIEVNFETAEGQKTYEKFKREILDEGYEGVMVKNPAAKYICKRRDAWLKVKPFIEVSLKVVDVEEGKAGTKYVGMLGALVCQGKDNGIWINVNVGSGISDEERIDWWNNKKKLVGMVAEVRADSVSQNQDGTYSLRFPRFKTWRGFKKGEKI